MLLLDIVLTIQELLGIHLFIIFPYLLHAFWASSEKNNYFHKLNSII